MLSTVAIVPSAPVMVPELVSAAAAETAELRDAARAAVAALPSRWLAVGVAADDGVAGPDSAGTFAGYGADVRIALSPAALSGPPAPQPLCVLVAGWLRGLAAPEAAVEVRIFGTGTAADAALAAGRVLRVELDADPDPVGVLVIADGANTLSPSAPGGHDPDSLPAQAALDDALAAGDPAALARTAAGAVGRVGYQVLAGLCEPGPRAAEQRYRGAPYGVGYFVGLWRP
ncbi:hypothetical protein [Mycolicibacterium sp.]|uniref:hypothetical protein n=1 Tax=Mycolicibacterium sp. TaxID=2320850 RepID=UPI003D0F3A3D